MKFAEMVKEARTSERLSQRKLAVQLVTAQKPEGVWGTYIGQIEKGEKVPADDVCLKLAEVLDLDADVVLLAAYEARAGSDAGRAMFMRMKRSLTDPVVRELLNSDSPLEPAIIAAISKKEIRTMLSDPHWVNAITRVHNMPKKRNVLALLPLLAAMDDKQWGAMIGIVETMGVQSI